MCNYDFKRSWWCSRADFHSGPCALRRKPRFVHSALRWLNRVLQDWA